MKAVVAWLCFRLVDACVCVCVVCCCCVGEGSLCTIYDNFIERAQLSAIVIIHAVVGDGRMHAARHRGQADRTYCSRGQKANALPWNRLLGQVICNP